MSDKYVDFFTGHLNALNRAYNKPTIEKLFEIYMKGEPYLRIFDESALEIAKTREEILETKDRVRDIQLEHLMTKSKIDVLKEQNERMVKEMATLKRIIESSETKSS